MFYLCLHLECYSVLLIIAFLTRKTEEVRKGFIDMTRNKPQQGLLVWESNQ